MSRNVYHSFSVQTEWKYSKCTRASSNKLTHSRGLALRAQRPHTIFGRWIWDRGECSDERRGAHDKDGEDCFPWRKVRTHATGPALFSLAAGFVIWGFVHFIQGGVHTGPCDGKTKTQFFVHQVFYFCQKSGSTETAHARHQNE